MKPRILRPVRGGKRLQLHTFSPVQPADAGAGQPHTQEHAPQIDPERRRAMIAEAAYYRAEQRGFERGRELEDWCDAENDIDSLLAHGDSPTPGGP